ncbi:MAG: sigma-54-dependent Fis family transcriptional regulator [Piscinibacter sp.]|nr:sigma-54-dependent Fis family transcriptional regulator [Piscinibacter sp.]
MSVLLQFHGAIAEASRDRLRRLLEQAGVSSRPAGDAGPAARARVIVFDAGNVRAAVDALRRHDGDGTQTIAVAFGPKARDADGSWALLAAGASDVLVWPEVPDDAEDLAHRMRRHAVVESLLAGDRVCASVAGHSPAWRSVLRSVIEAACFTSVPVLIHGETGTGKEQLARLVHDLGERAASGRFVVVDCTTLAPELSGSELFGHERGAFTGAVAPREGAFALAHRGTLFLDEIGELPLPLQAQLLRVLQERQYKRLGGNSWQDSDFRLVCATHRDLDAAVAEGRFRADLYHRIAGWPCTAPPLRERREDILPLAQFFLRQARCDGESGDAEPEVDIAPPVRELLLTRDYPGNVRQLRQLVLRLWHRHSGPGPLTVGDVPLEERPGATLGARWPDPAFQAAVGQAVELGIGLNEIGNAAKDLAVQLALEREGHNLHRAAERLQVSDRALQLRRQGQGAGAVPGGDAPAR